MTDGTSLWNWHERRRHFCLWPKAVECCLPNENWSLCRNENLKGPAFKTCKSNLLALSQRCIYKIGWIGNIFIWEYLIETFCRMYRNGKTIIDLPTVVVNVSLCVILRLFGCFQVSAEGLRVYRYSCPAQSKFLSYNWALVRCNKLLLFLVGVVIVPWAVFGLGHRVWWTWVPGNPESVFSLNRTCLISY